MSVDPEIFAIFQHKVERIPHFARVTEVRHIFFEHVLSWRHRWRMGISTICPCRTCRLLTLKVKRRSNWTIGSGFTRMKPVVVADPGFPRGGGAKSPGGCQHTILPYFPKNEIERIWVGGRPSRPLRSATVLHESYSTGLPHKSC